MPNNGSAMKTPWYCRWHRWDLSVCLHHKIVPKTLHCECVGEVTCAPVCGQPGAASDSWKNLFSHESRVCTQLYSRTHEYKRTSEGSSPLTFTGYLFAGTSRLWHRHSHSIFLISPSLTYVWFLLLLRRGLWRRVASCCLVLLLKWHRRLVRLLQHIRRSGGWQFHSGELLNANT